MNQRLAWLSIALGLDAIPSSQEHLNWAEKAIEKFENKDCKKWTIAFTVIRI